MQNNEISIVDLLKIAVKWLWLLIIGAVVAGVAAIFYAKFCITPTYKVVTKCYVQASEESMRTSSADALIGEQRGIALSQMIVNNYIEILDTNNFASEVLFYLEGGSKAGDSTAKLTKVKELGELEEEYTAKQIRSMISFNLIEEKVVFNISVVGANSDDIMRIAKCVEIVMMDYIENVAPGSGTIKVIDNARSNKSPINTNPMLIVVIGVILGAAIAFVVAFFIESNDTRVKDEKSLSKLIGLPVIGAIPDIEQFESTKK